MTTTKIQRLIESAPVAELVRTEVELLRGDQVVLESISWLWPGWLARGKLQILAGSPGTGKTTIALALAAVVSQESNWPDDTPAPLGDVIIWSGEDDVADTLAPRLMAMGADMRRIYFINGVSDHQGKRAFDPATDIECLAQKLATTCPALLIIDPIVSAVTGDSHKNTETRRALQPLVDLANRYSIAMLGITHFSKGTAGRNPTERVTGSLAFGAIARVVMVTAKKSEQDGGGRIFCRAKSNIGRDDGGFQYDLEMRPLADRAGMVASCVVWGAELQGSAQELLAQAEAQDNSEGGSLTEAKDFLANELAAGSVPVKQIKAAAEASGHSWATIKRAKEALGIKAEKVGMKDGWQWSLPSKVLNIPEDAQQKTVSTFAQNEHLRNHVAPTEWSTEL